MKNVAKILIIIIIISLLLVSFLGFCNTPKEKKAIIFLPGFMGSILKDEQNIYWLTYDALDMNYQEPWHSEKSFLVRLLDTFQDEEGNHKVEMYPASPYDKEFIGGTFNIYLDTYNLLEERFSNDYEIITFHYDFMKSDVENAKKLDAFIKENGYDSIVLVSHSMGGLVGDNYIALGQEQRDKVSLYVTLGSPHGGVVYALSVLETKYFGGIPSELNFLEPLIYNMARNMPSVIQMLPNKVMLDSPYYKNAEGGHPSFIKIETSQNEYKYLTDWEEIKEFYATREWAKYIDNEEKKGEVKPMFYEAIDMFEKLYYDTGDGTFEHITEKVNTYFIIGQLDYYNGQSCIQYNLDGSVKILNSKYYMDGTVAVPSASCGKSLDSENVFIYNSGHNSLANSINEYKDDPIDKFCELVRNLE